MAERAEDRIQTLRKWMVVGVGWFAAFLIEMFFVPTADGGASGQLAVPFRICFLLSLLLAVPVGRSLDCLARWSWTPRSLDPARAGRGDMRERWPFKSLRFFGAIGAVTVFLGGTMLAASIVFMFVSYQVALSPALLGGLFLMYGVQLIELGVLVGLGWEIIRMIRRVFVRRSTVTVSVFSDEGF